MKRPLARLIALPDSPHSSFAAGSLRCLCSIARSRNAQKFPPKPSTSLHPPCPYCRNPAVGSHLDGRPINPLHGAASTTLAHSLRETAAQRDGKFSSYSSFSILHPP